MNRRHAISLVFLLWVGSALAADPATSAQTSPPVAAAQVLTAGEIRAVDQDNQRVTIRHGDIENLGMPGMTMVFQVKPPATINTLKPGDKIRFHAEREGGKLIVTEVHPDAAPTGDHRP